MKKIICLVLATILTLSLCACSINSINFLSGTWTCGEDPTNDVLASTLVLNEDLTGTLTNGDTVYNVVWKVNPEDPDNVLLTTVGDITSTDDKFPVLTANMLVKNGIMMLNLYDGDAKDDFKLALLLERQP